jgi:hypothetical protein
MARVRAKETTIEADATATSIEVALPAHQTGDLLLIFISRDNNREDFSTPSGWTQVTSIGVGTTAATSNAVRAACYIKYAASSSEVNPTFTIINADEMSATALSIEGADPSVAIDVVTTSTDLVTPVISLPSITTVTNNALVFHYTASDGIALAHPPASWITYELDAQAVAISSSLIATVQSTAGATPAASLISISTTADESAIISLAIRDGSSGAITQAYPLVGSIDYIDPLRSYATASPGNYFSNIATDFTQIWNMGKTVPRFNPTSCYQVKVVGPVIINILAAATSATTNDVIPFPATEAVGDYLAVGYSSPFSGMLIDRTGCVNGVAGVVAYEYWNGTAWVALTFVANTSAAASADQAFRGTTIPLGPNQFIRWNIPTNWATLSLSGETADYKVRLRITTVYTTNPTLSRIEVFTTTQNTGFAQIATTSATNVLASGGLNFNESGILAYQLAGAANRTFSLSSFDPQATINLSSGLIAVSFYMGGGANYKNISTKVNGGGQFGICDPVTGNLKTWCVASVDSQDTSPTDLMTAVIQPSQTTDTTWTKTVTSPDLSNIPNFFLGWMNWSGGIRTAVWSRLVYIPSTYHICGGGSGSPITWLDILEVANAYEFPLINGRTGISSVPIQFGGSRSCYVDASIFALSWAPRADYASDYSKNHVDDGYQGVVIDCRAGDTLKLRNASIVGNSKIRFEMLATCSASATYSFSGLTLVNANVTLRPVTTFDSIQFINCTSLIQNAAVIESCTFSGSTVTSDLPDNISNCAFTCNNEHAIEFTAAAIGTHNLYGNTFSGYGAAGSSTAAIYNNSGGLVTLYLSEGDVTPTVRNGAGSTTVINAPQAQAQVINITSGSRIQVYNVTTNTELVNTVVTGTTWSLFYDNGTSISAGDTIRLRLVYVSGLSAKRAWSSIAIATSTGFSVIAQQVNDLIYQQFGINGSTVTEFTFDTPNLQIDISDPDNIWFASRLYAYMMFYQMSASGIANAFDTVYGTDNGNVRLNGAYLDNLSTNTAKQGDAIRIYREDDLLPVINPTTGGGGLTFFSTGTIYIAETGTSGLTPEETTTLNKLNTIEPLVKLIPATV